MIVKVKYTFAPDTKLENSFSHLGHPPAAFCPLGSHLPIAIRNPHDPSMLMEEVVLCKEVLPVNMGILSV